jgi:hypothetical protein
MARRRERTDALWQTDGARIRAAVDSTRAEIRAVLTPAQATEYDRLRAERDAKKRREQAARDSAAQARDGAAGS